MKLRIVKYHYRGGENEHKYRFYIEEYKKVWWSYFLGWNYYKWKRVQELVGGFGDCWYEDRSYSNLEEAEEYCRNSIQPLPENPIVSLYSSRDELGL